MYLWSQLQQYDHGPLIDTGLKAESQWMEFQVKHMAGCFYQIIAHVTTLSLQREEPEALGCNSVINTGPKFRCAPVQSTFTALYQIC